MGDKSQVTIFIIIAILIIAGVVLFFAFKGGIEKKEIISPEVAPVQEFVEECLEEIGEEVIYKIGQQGGYRSPENVFESNEQKFAYYLINENNYMPSKERIENETSDYLNVRIFLCTENFANFTDYKIEQGNLESSVQILDDKVILKMDYPLTIQKKDSESKSIVREFETEISIRAGLVYGFVNSFINEQEKYKEFCLSCLSDDLVEKNISVEMINKINNTLTFTFKDNYAKLNNKTFEWSFANKY